MNNQTTAYHMFTEDERFEPMSAVDAALERGALFEVKTQPLVVDGFTPRISKGTYAGEPEHVIFFRELGDERMVLNIAHPSHPASNYLPVLEQAEALFPNSVTSLAVLEDGKRLMFEQTIDDDTDLGDGGYGTHLLWTASLNGTWPTRAAGMFERFFCSNQLPSATTHISVKRTVNHDLLLSLRSQIMAGIGQDRDALHEKVSSLRAIKITDAQFRNLVAQVLPRPEGKDGNEPSTRAMNTWERKVAACSYFWGEESEGPAAGTAWAAWNAIQSAEAHVFTRGVNQRRDHADMVTNNRQPVTELAERVLVAV